MFAFFFGFFVFLFHPSPHPIIWDEGRYFWHQQTVSTEVDINESLITTQLRLMASIFCPLFSFDGGSIKVGHVPEGRTHKVGITKQGKILIFGFCLQGFGDCFCLVVFLFLFHNVFIKTQRNDEKFVFYSINKLIFSSISHNTEKARLHHYILLS